MCQIAGGLRRCLWRCPLTATIRRLSRVAMVERRLDSCMSEVFDWNDLPEAHMKMMRNEHKPGNMSVLVQSPKTGLRTIEDVLDARKA